MFCQLFSLQNKSFLYLQHVENKGFQTVIKHRLKAIQKPIKNELEKREKNTKNAHFVLKKCTFRFRDYTIFVEGIHIGQQDIHMSHVDNVEELVKQDRWLQCGKSAYTFKKADLPLCSKKQLAQNFYNVGVVIDLTLFPFLFSPSSLLAANIVLSILSHLRTSHVLSLWCRYRRHLGFHQSW